MADIIQQRRDTAARWAQYNPILLEGEVGYVTDNPNQYKIGNGRDKWNDLPLRGYTGTITQDTGDDENAVMSQKAVTGKLSELGQEVGNKVEISCDNLIDPSKIEYGKAITLSGSIYNEASRNVLSDFIPVNGGNISSSNAVFSEHYCGGVYTSKDQNRPIRTITSSPYTYQEGDMFIRLTFTLNDANANRCMANYGNVALPYKEYNPIDGYLNNQRKINEDVYRKIGENEYETARKVAISTTNLVDLSKILENKAIDRNKVGSFYDSSVCDVSDFIPVDGWNISSNALFNDSFCAAVYSEKNNDSLIRLVTSSPYIFQEGDKYIRFTFRHPESGEKQYMANYGEELLPYEKFNPIGGYLKSQNKDIAELKQKSELAEQEINTLNESFIGYKDGENVPVLERTSGKYINADGSLAEWRSYNLATYNVEGLSKVRIQQDVLDWGDIDPGAIFFALYSSNELTKENCIYVSNKKLIDLNSSVNESIDLQKYQTAKVLAISMYPSRFEPSVINVEKARINLNEISENVDRNTKDIEVLKSKSAEIPCYCVELHSNGEDLFIAYLDGNTEYVYWFRKAMENLLYTFYRVGYRTVSRNYPDTEGISTLQNIVLINKTGSDNIGPIGFQYVGGVKSGYGLVGGNHSWGDNKTSVGGTIITGCKTARNDSFKIYSDGKELISGSKFLSGSPIVIYVENTLFDPNETPSIGQEILTVPAIKETVIYRVIQNNIQVSLREHVLDSVTNNILDRYYGMQSMFLDEEYVITPNAMLADWTANTELSSSYTSGSKDLYPKFNRFIEKKSGAYQSTYLMPNKNGTHNLVVSGGSVVQVNNDKKYHRIIDGYFTQPSPNTDIVWSGVYTFFNEAVLDDENVLAYYGNIDGEDVLFVYAKKASVFNIPMKEQYLFRRIEFIEKDDKIETENTFVDVEGISITSSGQGSAIIRLIK